MYSANPLGSNLHRDVFPSSTQLYTAPVLNEKEQEYLNKIIELPLDSIVDCSAGEMKCREICEEMYDYFKKEANDDGSAGETALQHITDSLPSASTDGFLRGQYFNNVWRRVNFEAAPFERGCYSYSSLNAKEEEYLKKFIDLYRRNHFVFDVAIKKCHDLGQEIFDYFKEEANGDSFAGKKALLNISDQLQYDCASMFSKLYVSRAWNMVGDNNWHWRY